MDEFRGAICALFSTQDASSQQAANQWLHDFAPTPAAWEASLSILEPNVPANVAFFAANMLLNKTRTEWSRMPLDSRAQITSVVSSKLQTFIQGNGDMLVCQRLYMVLASMAVRTNTDAVQAYVTQALNTASQAQSAAQLQSALGMLTEMQHESTDLDTQRATANSKAMSSSASAVLTLIQQVLANVHAAGGEAVAITAVKCLHAWCDGAHAGMGTTPRYVTLARLHAEHSQLLSALFQLLGSESSDLREQVVSVLVALLGDAPEDTDGPVGGTWRSALVLVVAFLVALRPAVDAGGDQGAEIARSVARCGTAISEASTEFVCGCLPTTTPTRGRTEPEALDGVAPASPRCNSPAVPASGPPPAKLEHAALQLAELMLACLARPERTVADAALDYFININTVIVQHRLPQMRSAVFGSALLHLLRHACYPPKFTTWDQEDEDEETFYSFRDNQLSELLECCYAMMGQQYLSIVTQAASAPPSWQQYEASLYCLRAVNMPVKLKILGRDRADAAFEARPADELASALEASSLLDALMADLCDRPEGGPAARYLSNAWVLKEGSRLVGEYATWFARAGNLWPGAAQAPAGVPLPCAPQPPLEGALNMLLLALPVVQAQRGAAQAFRNLCIRCAGRLSQPAALRGLMDAVMRIVAPPPSSSETSASPGPSPAAPSAAVSSPRAHSGLARSRSSRSSSGLAVAAGSSLALGPDERTAVVEGLGRVVAALPPEAMGDAGVALTAPLVLRAQALAQAGTSVRVEALLGLADDLTLLAAALRFMDFPGNPPPGMAHPALKVLEHAWPVLAGVAEHPLCQREPDVVASLCDVYQRALLSARSSARGLLPTLINSVGAMFAAAPHPGPCDVLGTAVELFGEMRSVPEVATLQAQALAGAAASAVAVLQAAGTKLAVHADLLRSLFACADRYFVFARDILLMSPALGPLITLGTAVVGLREREPVAAVLAFLTHVIAVTEKLQAEDEAAQRRRVEEAMAADGEKLVRALLNAAADSCPRQLARPLAGALWALLHSAVFGAAAAAWLGGAMQAPEFRGVCARVMSEEEVGRFCALLLRRPPLPRARFDALVADLSGVLRGEASADVVLAYEM